MNYKTKIIKAASMVILSSACYFISQYSIIPIKINLVAFHIIFCHAAMLGNIKRIDRSYMILSMHMI